MLLCEHLTMSSDQITGNVKMDMLSEKYNENIVVDVPLFSKEINEEKDKIVEINKKEMEDKLDEIKTDSVEENNSEEIIKMEKGRPETDYIEDVSNSNFGGNHTNDSRYCSISASMERLSKLPYDILNVFNIINIGVIFGVFLLEIRKRNKQLAKNQGIHSTVRMWTGNVYFFCYKFHKKHFQNTFYVDKIPNCITEFIKMTPITDLLQIFIDVIQQKSYFARKQLKVLYHRDVIKRNKKEIIQLKIRCRYFENMYYDFVDLYKKCTGNKIPKKMAREFRGKHTYYGNKPAFHKKNRTIYYDYNSPKKIYYNYNNKKSYSMLSGKMKAVNSFKRSFYRKNRVKI